MLLSLVIPAHNEEKRIGKTLDDYLLFFSKDTEFLVVLNGCRDDTLGVVRQKQEKFASLKYLNIEEAIGKGGAIREGFKAVNGELIGFVDADEATSPLEFQKLLRNLAGYDGVIASRYLRGAVAKRTLVRRIVSLGFYVLAKMLFRLPYRDTQCGAKVFKKKVVKKILPEMKVNNMLVDLEMLSLARKYGYRIKETPTVWEEKDSSALLGSPFKLIKNSFILFFSLIKLRLRI